MRGFGELPEGCGEGPGVVSGRGGYRSIALAVSGVGGRSGDGACLGAATAPGADARGLPDNAHVGRDGGGGEQGEKALSGLEVVVNPLLGVCGRVHSTPRMSFVCVVLGFGDGVWVGRGC